jgi:hypothetical protein
MKSKTLLSILVVSCLMLVTQGCALNIPTGRDSPTEEDASQIAEQALMALNEGNYDSFVIHFGERLSEAMTEAIFLELRTTKQETSGQFLSMSDPKLVKTSSPEAIGYVYTCKFEKEEFS